MKTFFLQFFTWWNGQTIGTRFHTWRHGERVGEDNAGNIYYQSAEGKRWVIYNGIAEASAIEPGWHGWMHYRVDTPPSEQDYKPKEWQKPHQPNLTGTSGAYRPKGSVASQEKRPRVTGDYDAWAP